MKIEIYTKDNCVFCTSAKALLKSRNKEFTEIHMPSQISREALMEKFPGVKTVPIIIINDNNIGGYTELQQVLGGS